MTPHQPIPDPQTEVRELNRLFLEYLRAQPAGEHPDLDLPGNAGQLLRRAPGAALARLANYPQALFRIDIGQSGERDVCEPRLPGELPPALFALQSMLLVSARHLARQSPFAARLFLRLSPESVRELATLPLPALPMLAARSGVVRCAFSRFGWMWGELVREREPAEDRALILLGLQPNIELNRPVAFRP